MYYAYVVEYIDLERLEDGSPLKDHQCTIGNGILSKYPIKNVKTLRYKNQCCKLGSRLGGRVSLIADIEISEELSVKVNNVHLEAGTSDNLA